MTIVCGSATICLCGYWKLYGKAGAEQLGFSHHLFVWLLEACGSCCHASPRFSHHLFVWLLEERNAAHPVQNRFSHHLFVWLLEGVAWCDVL